MHKKLAIIRLAARLCVLSCLGAVSSVRADTNMIIGWACGGRDAQGGILLCASNGADWFRSGAGCLGTNALAGVAAIGRRVWVVGEPADGYAAIFHSADAGKTWERQGNAESLPDIVLQKIRAVNRNVLWAVGPTGTVVTTADGGLTWRNVSVPDFANMLQGVTAVDAATAWVSGEAHPATGYAALFHTRDGGANWELQTNGAVATVSHLLGLAALDAQRVWAIGARETVLATTNAGATWKLVAQGPLEDGNELRVLDGQRIWTANDAHVSWTTNGGLSWGSHNTAEYTMDVATPDGTNVWAVSGSYRGGAVYYSPDGGATWSRQAVSNQWGRLFTIAATCLIDPDDKRFRPAGADFDGDGKADPVIYRPFDGEWRARLSSIGYGWVRMPRAFGESDYAPVAADFDGDGLADPALYHEVNGIWRILLSGTDYAELVSPWLLGGRGCAALAADFDGDGKSDPAAYQAGSGDWEIRLSSSGYALIPLNNFLGGTGWSVLAADFDGDRLADPAVYEAATGNWQIKFSGAGYAVVPLSGLLGGTGWSALAADFDGDGKADPAVAHTSSGHWQIKLSSQNYTLIELPDFLSE